MERVTESSWVWMGLYPHSSTKITEQGVGRPGESHFPFAAGGAAGRCAPQANPQQEGKHGGQGGQNIGELGVDEVGDQELRAGEGDAAQRRGGQHAAQAFPAGHDQNQVGRHEEGDRGADAAHAGAETVERQAGGDRRGW